MFKYILTAIIAFLFALTVMQSKAWDHAVIMKPHEGATYTVPLVPGFPNCVYVTDCKASIYNSESPGTPADLPATTPPPEPLVAISEVPNIRGIEGWSFGVPIEDRSGWVATADDEEPNGGSNYKAMAAIDPLENEDGTPNYSQWHTTWSADVDPPLPHWIAIDLGKQHWVDGLIYTPRVYEPDKEWYINGNILDYEVWVSKTGCEAPWGRVAKGTFEYEDPPVQTPKTIEFSIPNFVQCVKLVALTAMGRTPETAAAFASARDIQITESLKDIIIEGGAVQ